jgi:hypothetical protein
MATTGPIARVRAFAATPAGGLTLIVVAGVLVVAAVPFWLLRRAGETDASKAFVSSPEFIVWALILCAQAAMWVGAAAYVVATVTRRVRDLRAVDALPRTTVTAILIAAVGVALVTVLLLFGARLHLYGTFTKLRGLPDPWPLEGHTRKMVPFVVTAMLIGFVAIAGMWLTALGFADVRRRATPTREWVERFVSLRSELTTLLAIIAALIGIATLSSGALREAVLAENRLSASRDAAVTCIVKESRESETAVRARLDDFVATYPDCQPWQFDRRYVLAYGLLFSSVLALAFAPSFLVMRRSGDELRDVSYPLPDPGDPRFFDVVEQRSAFDALLQTNLSGTVAFKAAAAILTPLAASLVSTLVPT